VGLTLALMVFRMSSGALDVKDRTRGLVVAALMGIAGGYGFFRLNVRPPTTDGLLRMMKSAHRCVCCGYDLCGLASEQAGCTVCPECGAAWRLDATR
jgi:hypothetical protein